jgi:hypothetical protein
MKYTAPMPKETTRSSTPAFARKVIATLVISSFFVSAVRTQEAQSGPRSLIVTLVEFQVGRMGSFTNCINVWEDGRFHLERRIQPDVSAHAVGAVYEATLPEAQLLALKQILESDQLRLLPPMEPIEHYAGKTWMSGFRAKTVRDGTEREVGYFEFGLYDPAKHSESVGVSDPRQKNAVRTLQEWFHHVNSRSLSLPGAEPTMCEIASAD